MCEDTNDTYHTGAAVSEDLTPNLSAATDYTLTSPTPTQPHFHYGGPRQHGGEKVYIWTCCKCGGENNYKLNPGCTNGYCGHWVEGCKYCQIEEVQRKS